MRFLRKILLAIGLILLLACLKSLFRKLFPQSLVFTYNLLSALQLLLLSWAVVTGLLETTVWKRLPKRSARIKSFSVFLIILALADTGCCWLLHHPEHLPPRCLPAFSYYYNNYDRNILQYDPRLSRYDTALFYRMKSDLHGVFANIEFSDSILTDARGFRTNTSTPGHTDTFSHPDTPGHANTQPTVLCLGDSYTLGWGVSQDQCFPALLQDSLGTPVLNTGMSSYGTAREIASIRDLDKSSLSTVVIQYCYNDADENLACVNNGFHPVISPPAVYDSAISVLRWSNAWFPGKYACTLFKLLLDSRLHRLSPDGPAHPTLPDPGLHRPRPTSTQPDDSARYTGEANRFLAILQRSGLDFTHTRVFVFDIGEYASLTGKFVTALEGQLAAPPFDSAFHGQIHPLHIENLLTPADYYLLDIHLRPTGHRKLASYLAHAISAAP